MAEHVWDPARIHHSWDLDLAPALEIASGDVVHFAIPMAGEGQVAFGARFDECRFDFDTIYNLAGPIAVAGAQPGDTLRIDILSLKTGDWGWCAMLPGIGLLADDFPQGYVRTFPLTSDPIPFAAGITIPKAPFFGTMGNHPGEPRTNVPFPPHRGGGNMDNRHLQVGTTLWLPVHVPGAHFSVGDPHACQGDGEVCVAALECPMSATLRFTLERKTLPCPQWRSPGALTPRTDSGGYHGTMGIADDLMEGARAAVRAMIAWLGDEHGLAPQDAYILCSLAGDLKIIEIVDAGMWNVGMTMPLSLFDRSA
jgi:acetamidase/formamidase